MRRLLYSLCLIALLHVSGYAQIHNPNQINYQGRLTDGAGSPVADGPYLIKFTIYDGPGGGATDLWNSGFQNITVINGLFNYALGSDVAFPDGLFADSVRYLGITVGVDPEITPRTRLLAAAYAIEGPFVSLTGDVMSGPLSIDDPGGQVVILDPSQTGDGAAVLPPNSISLSEIDSTQVPRVAQLIFPTTTKFTVSTASVALDTFQVSWPADGYLFIQVSGQSYLNIDATGSSSETHFGEIGLCTSPNSSSNCDQTFQSMFFQDADNASSTNETGLFLLSTVVPVFGSGTDTYYLNARTANASYGFYIYKVRATVMYFPLSGGLPILSPPSADNGPTLQQD